MLYWFSRSEALICTAKLDGKDGSETSRIQSTQIATVAQDGETPSSQDDRPVSLIVAELFLGLLMERFRHRQRR